MDKESFIDLIDHYVAGTLSKEGWQQLKHALDDPANGFLLPKHGPDALSTSGGEASQARATY